MTQAITTRAAELVDQLRAAMRAGNQHEAERLIEVIDAEGVYCVFIPDGSDLPFGDARELARAVAEDIDETPLSEAATGSSLSAGEFAEIVGAATKNAVLEALQQSGDDEDEDEELADDEEDDEDRGAGGVPNRAFASRLHFRPFPIG